MKPIFVRSLVTCAVCYAIASVQGQFQTNTQIYGHNTGGSVRYSQGYTNNLLPSEMRHNAWKSGALPSEGRLNARAVGPLAPTGNRAYIPPARTYGKTPDYSMGSIHNAPQSAHTPINPILTNYPNLKR